MSASQYPIADGFSSSPWMDDSPSKDRGGPPKAHEGWGLLLETGEQISSRDKKLSSWLLGTRENVSSPSESILSTPSLASALIIWEISSFSSKERRLPSSRYWALVIAWNWLTEFVNAFISSLIEESKGALLLIPEGAMEELVIVVSIGLLKVCVALTWGRVSLNSDPDELLGPVTELGILETEGVKICLEPSKM